MFEPLFTPLFSSLLSPLIAPAQKVFITLNGTDAHYTAESAWLATDPAFLDVEIEFFTSTVTGARRLISWGDNSSDFPICGIGSTLSNPSKLSFRYRQGALDGNFGVSTTLMSSIQRVHLTVVGTALNIDINDGSELISITLPATIDLSAFNRMTIGALGRLGITDLFKGIIAGVKLTDPTTPSNSESWQLNRLTANTEQSSSGNNLLTYVNIPTGAPDRELFTKNTSTDPDQWENADKSRIIQIA